MVLGKKLFFLKVRSTLLPQIVFFNLMINFILDKAFMILNPLKKMMFALFFLGTVSQIQAEVKVYVPLGNTNEILVIDGEKDSVTGQIKELTNPHGLAGNSREGLLVAASMWETPRVAEQSMPSRPQGMSQSEHQSHHNMGGREKKQSGNQSFISIIDMEEGRVIRQVEVEGMSHHTLITPNGKYAISTHPSLGKISVIDLKSGEIIKRVATGPMPNYVLASRDGNTVYVSNGGNNTISEIDTKNWIVRRNFMTGTRPEHMVLSSDENTLYVNNVADGTVSSVSVSKGVIVKNYTVGKTPHGIDISEDGSTLFVSLKGDNKLTALDLASGKHRSLALAPSPYHLTVIQGTGKLYVSSRAESLIWVIDQKSLKLLKELPIRGNAHQMVVIK